MQKLDAAINKDVEYPSEEYDNLNAERDEILQNLREQGHNEYHFSSEKLYVRGLTLTLNELPENKQLLEPGEKEQKKQKSTG